MNIEKFNMHPTLCKELLVKHSESERFQMMIHYLFDLGAKRVVIRISPDNHKINVLSDGVGISHSFLQLGLFKGDLKLKRLLSVANLCEFIQITSIKDNKVLIVSINLDSGSFVVNEPESKLDDVIDFDGVDIQLIDLKESFNSIFESEGFKAMNKHVKTMSDIYKNKKDVFIEFITNLAENIPVESIGLKKFGTIGDRFIVDFNGIYLKK